MVYLEKTKKWLVPNCTALPVLHKMKNAHQVLIKVVPPKPIIRLVT